MQAAQNKPYTYVASMKCTQHSTDLDGQEANTVASMVEHVQVQEKGPDQMEM